MEKYEQPIATQEISPAEILKRKASEKVNEDIAELQEAYDATDLSEDFVLTSKMGVRELGECKQKMDGYKNELTEIDAGNINPEYVIYQHSDVPEKMSAISEKVDPESELGKILMSKQELAKLPPEQREFVTGFATDLNKLRNIAEQQSGAGAEEKNDLENMKISLSMEVKRRQDEFFKTIKDPNEESALRGAHVNFEKYLSLQDRIRNGRGFAESDTTKLEYEDSRTQSKMPTWYGKINEAFSQFKALEQENFPRDPQKNIERVAEKTELKTEIPAAIEKTEPVKIEETSTKDAEALRRVRESLGLKNEPLDAVTSVKPEKTFVSPETLNAYKNTVEEMSGNFGSLDRVLRNRDDERLAELIDSDEIGRMSSIIRRLSEIDIKEQQDFEEISTSFARLHDSIESIGTIRSRSVKDDVDSLKTVANALMMAGESTQDVARQLKIMETAEALQAAKQAEQLADTLFDRRMAMLRRMDRIGDYLR